MDMTPDAPSRTVAEIVAHYRMSAATKSNPRASGSVTITSTGIEVAGGTPEARSELLEAWQTRRDEVIEHMTRRCDDCARVPDPPGLGFESADTPGSFRCLQCFRARAARNFPDPLTTAMNRWAAEGEATGHAWRACDKCGEPVLTKDKLKSKESPPKCRMTLGCDGRHRTPFNPERKP